MPLKHYSVLKGRPIAMRFGTGQSPHYQVHVVADNADFRIAVNVQSGDGSEVEFRSRSHHPITDHARGAAGKRGLDGPLARPKPASIALGTFIRGNLMQPQEMIPLPLSVPGPDNDLNEKLDQFVQRALSNESAMIYAFGETWGPETKADNYFGFRPGRGIHDIHMNQGNPIGRFSGRQRAMARRRAGVRIPGSEAMDGGLPQIPDAGLAHRRQDR